MPESEISEEFNEDVGWALTRGPIRVCVAAACSNAYHLDILQDFIVDIDGIQAHGTPRLVMMGCICINQCIT